MTPLQLELLELIETTCKLPAADRETFDVNGALIGPDSALGIDSLDALEIAVTVQQRYGVRMNSENTTRSVLRSLASLAEYVAAGESAAATG